MVDVTTIKNRRVVFTANNCWDIYNYRRGIVRELIGAGVEVVVVAPADDYSAKLSELGCNVINIDFSTSGTNPVKDFMTWLGFYKIYKEMKPGLVFHYAIKPNIYGSFAAGLLRIPCVSLVTGLGYTFLHKNIVAKVARLLYKMAFLIPKRVIFLNDDDLNVFVNGNILKAEKAAVWPGEGVDVDCFAPELKKTPNKVFSFLFSGRILWDKGIAELVDAIKILKQKGYEFEVVLSGFANSVNPATVQKHEIDQWISEGLVKYDGHSNDIKKLINMCDCLILPSYREGVSRSLMEAAAMERPIITTDVPGCREVVEDGVNGFLCKVKDAQDLADKMEKMINLSEEERLEMGLKGREKMVGEFDEKIVIKKYMEVIKEVLGSA